MLLVDVLLVDVLLVSLLLVDVLLVEVLLVHLLLAGALVQIVDYGQHKVSLLLCLQGLVAQEASSLLSCYLHFDRRIWLCSWEIGCRDCFQTLSLASYP